MKYRAIIVEDEQLARERLQKLLANHQDHIEVIGEATDGQEGLELAEALKPDLIFLDIQMPLKDGFQMLQELNHAARIIFTTAFDQYAIKAFEENSIDYLLKPIEQERLDKSISKLSSLDKNNNQDLLKDLIEKLATPQMNTLTVKLGDRMIMLPIEELVYLHAEDKYVFAHHQSGKKHLLSSSLVELEKSLPKTFIRIHRAYMINSKFITEIHKGTKGKLDFLMRDENQTKISSSQSYTPKVRQLLGL
jgi:two-component system LytT family response regulator